MNSKQAKQIKKSNDYAMRVVKETWLAMAQASICNALKQSGMSKRELAREMGKPRSFVTRMLRGEHNITVKTYASAIVSCGFEPVIHFLPTASSERRKAALDWANDVISTLNLHTPRA